MYYLEMPQSIKHFWKEVNKHDTIQYSQCWLFRQWGGYFSHILNMFGDKLLNVCLVYETIISDILWWKYSIIFIQEFGGKWNTRK